MTGRARSRTGRAGTHPAPGGQASPVARAGRRGRFSVVALAIATLTAVVPVPPVASATAVLGNGTPPLVAPGGDDVTDSDRPVRIAVGRFEPRTVTPGAVVTVTGTLTNTGTATITDLGVRLQRGDVVTTRAELAAIGRNPDPATTVVPAFSPLAGELAPGGKVAFSYTIPSQDLQLNRDGVYPVLLNVNGTVDGDQRRRVGQLPTYVVQQPVVPTAHTTVAWLWPLTERSHRNAAGGFVDDTLTDRIRSGGRLDRALAVLERLPKTLPPGGTQPVPALSVTLAIDPALIEELTVMAAGPYPVNGVAGAGHGTEDAIAFLGRLKAVAAVHPVVALPYGDVDADALDAAGLSAVLTRSLPGTPAGTAQDRPGSNDSVPATSAPAAAPATPTPGGPGQQPTEGAGARILADALDVAPRTDLAWAPGGSLRPGALATMQDGGVDEVILGTSGLTDGEAAVGLGGPAAAAHTRVSTAKGPLDALVADPALGSMVGSAERAAGGPRMAEQRYLAELAVLTQQAPPGGEQSVLVAPSRDVDAGPDGAGAMMADTAGLPWLRPGALDALFGGPVSPAGELAQPVDTARLDPAGMAAVVESVASRDDLAGVVVGDPGVALHAYDAGTARTVSVAWRSDPTGFRAAAADLRATITHLRGQVTLLAPANGTYSLASSDAPLVLTVRNGLPFAVQVRLELRARGTRGLAIDDIGPQTLAPGERTTLQVPTHVRQSGGFAVTASLATPGGQPLGERVQMQVKSTTYGPISVIITIGAASLLALLFLRRLVNFVLRRRRAGQAGSAGVPDDALSQPPTRSPV